MSSSIVKMDMVGLVSSFEELYGKKQIHLLDVGTMEPPSMRYSREYEKDQDNPPRIIRKVVVPSKTDKRIGLPVLFSPYYVSCRSERIKESSVSATTELSVRIPGKSRSGERSTYVELALRGIKDDAYDRIGADYPGKYMYFINEMLENYLKKVVFDLPSKRKEDYESLFGKGGLRIRCANQVHLVDNLKHVAKDLRIGLRIDRTGEGELRIPWLVDASKISSGRHSEEGHTFSILEEERKYFFKGLPVMRLEGYVMKPVLGKLKDPPPNSFEDRGCVSLGISMDKFYFVEGPKCPDRIKLRRASSSQSSVR